MNSVQTPKYPSQAERRAPALGPETRVRNTPAGRARITQEINRLALWCLEHEVLFYPLEEGHRDG
jgi:hypothetical protein